MCWVLHYLIIFFQISFKSYVFHFYVIRYIKNVKLPHINDVSPNPSALFTSMFAWIRISTISWLSGIAPFFKTYLMIIVCKIKVEKEC